MFQLRNDHTLWELADSDPKFNALFNDGMNSDTELIMDIVVNEFGEVFHGSDSLIDVAGGHGGAAHAIGKAFPHLKCSVLELGHVVADAPNDTSVHYIAGDMFETVPPASMIFLKVCGRVARYQTSRLVRVILAFEMLLLLNINKINMILFNFQLLCT